MTFLQKLMMLTVLAVVIALTGLARRRTNPRSSGRARLLAGPSSVAAWLAVIAAALMVVGIVSHTLLRHLVQVAPLVVAMALSLRRSVLAAAAAAPLFAFWLLFMTAIWLFLLGIARIFTGTFTSVEITLTIVIGIGSVLGLLAAFTRGAGALTVERLGVIIGFAIFEFAAVWVSLQPFVARR